MILVWCLASSLLGQVQDEFDYGEAYITETRDRSAPRLHLGIGYGFNISNSFLKTDGLMANAQLRVWKYLSTGIFALVNRSELSSKNLTKLQDADLLIKFSTPRWGVFSLSTFQVMLGRWNFLNLCHLESEILFGGGLGILNRGLDIDGPNENKFSYLWWTEHRFNFADAGGVFISLLGHLDTAYLQAGLHLRFQ